WLGRRGRPNELLKRDPALLSDVVRPYTDYPAGHAEGYPDTFKQLFRAVYADVAAREAGEPTAAAPLYARVMDGHGEVALCAAIARSACEGRWVEVGAAATRTVTGRGAVMQLGFVSAILSDLTLEEVLKFAADEGFSCVELMCWP